MVLIFVPLRKRTCSYERFPLLLQASTNGPVVVFLAIVVLYSATTFAVASTFHFHFLLNIVRFLWLLSCVQIATGSHICLFFQFRTCAGKTLRTPVKIIGIQRMLCFSFPQCSCPLDALSCVNPRDAVYILHHSVRLIRLSFNIKC